MCRFNDFLDDRGSVENVGVRVSVVVGLVRGVDVGDVGESLVYYSDL